MLAGMTLAFDNAYEGVPSWETGRLQPVVERLLARGRSPAPSSTPAVARGAPPCASPSDGHPVVGIDIAARAVALARQLAAEAGVPARFMVGDALELATATGVLAESFDTVLDVGLFHVLQPADRGRYAASLASAVPPGGTALVVAWSDRNPFGYGPERVTRRAIRAAFGRTSGWRVESIEEEQLESRLGTGVVHAWLASSAGDDPLSRPVRR